MSDDDPITSYVRRKAALRRQVAVAGDEALTLFAADKLSNVQELRREQTLDPHATSSTGPRRQLRTRRLKHYRRSLALLQERLPDSPMVTELRDEVGVFPGGQAALASAS